jgi:hypothetical protein
VSEAELREMVAIMEADRLRHTSTPEAAEQYLRDMGFLDADGNLIALYATAPTQVGAA